MFPAPVPRSRTPRNVALGVAVLLLLAIGLWFGGHPSWLPTPLRSAFVSESSTQKLENQVYGLLTKDYYRPLNRSTLVNKGLEGAVASLDDPYSHYYDPSDYHSFQNTTTDPHEQGIGIAVTSVHAGLLVDEVYAHTPAAKAGIVDGDVITHVGRASLQGRSETVAAHLIQGRPGTTVTLSVKRKGSTRTLTIARSNIAVPVTASKLLHYHGTKIGYVQLTMFSQGAGNQVRDQVKKMQAKGAQAMILDLRNNGGGLLEEAVNTASVFIPDGTIVSTDGRAQPRQVYMARGDAIAPTIPLVVLANQDTASSAEIVTGALKDRGRATVVGTHTYGKGVFQEIEPLRNGGALDFTVGEYFTPNGQNLGGGGVKRGHGILPNVYAAEPTPAKGSHPSRPLVDHQLRVAEKTVAAKLK
jgi:carboxyl-terminal processing protease